MNRAPAPEDVIDGLDFIAVRHRPARRAAAGGVNRFNLGQPPRRCSLRPPDWHIKELERRIAAADANPGAGEPWETVLTRLLKSS